MSMDLIPEFSLLRLPRCIEWRILQMLYLWNEHPNVSKLVLLKADLLTVIVRIEAIGRVT